MTKRRTSATYGIPITLYQVLLQDIRVIEFDMYLDNIYIYIYIYIYIMLYVSHITSLSPACSDPNVLSYAVVILFFCIFLSCRRVPPRRAPIPTWLEGSVPSTPPSIFVYKRQVFGLRRENCCCGMATCQRTTDTVVLAVETLSSYKYLA